MSKIDHSSVKLAKTKCIIVTKRTFSQKISGIKKDLKSIYHDGYLWYLICMSFMCGAICVNFNSLILASGDIGLDDIRINSLFLNTVEALMSCLAICIAPYVPRKTYTIFSFSLIVAGAVLLVIFRNVLPSFHGERMVETIIVAFILKAALSVQFIVLYAYLSEMFPTRIRGISHSIVFNVGKLLGLTSTLLIVLSTDVLNTNAMVCGAMTCLVTIPMIMFLPETKGKKVE